MYFNDNIVKKSKNTVDLDGLMFKWDDDYQHQLCQEALQFMGHTFNEVEGMCLKTEHFSSQSDVRRCGEKGKISAIKDARNLVEKNECFGEVSKESPTKDMKSKALPLLIFMVAKRNFIIKSRVVANGGAQKICTVK